MLFVSGLCSRAAVSVGVSGIHENDSFDVSCKYIKEDLSTSGVYALAGGWETEQTGGDEANANEDTTSLGIASRESRSHEG